MKEVYNIGLDIGTSSVGYAMTDEKGRLLRFHKRPTYGSVLFEEAQTAKERRQKRSARRRLARRASVSNCCKHWLRRMCVRQTQRFFFG